MRVPASDVAKDQPNALAVASRNVTHPVFTFIADRLLANIAFSPELRRERGEHLPVQLFFKISFGVRLGGHVC